MTSLPAVLAAIGPASTPHDVEELLRDDGWTPSGTGDWAFALGSPDGELVARISPFDPMGPYTARLYREAATTGLVPCLLAHRRLAGGGDLQVMERLHEVPEATAAEFLERFARPDPDLEALAEAVRRVHEEALHELRWCGPLDTNPSNIMRAADGHLVLIDPYYADGPNLYELAARAPDRFVMTIPEEERRFLTEIPLAWSGPWPAAEREALSETLHQADRRRRARGAAHASGATGPSSPIPPAT